MKKLILTAALVTVIASPALAQQTQRQVLDRPAAQAAQTTPYGRTEAARPHSVNPSYDVYSSSGHYIGSDPDVRVRQDIERDQVNGGD
jgi:uncharacterized lipoprotein